MQPLTKTNTMVAFYSRYLPSLEELLHLLKFSANTKNLNFGKSIHTQLLIRNQSSTHHSYSESNIIQLNSLINLYVKCSKLRFARYLFDEMSLRNVVSYNALMGGYLHSGEHLEVVKLFKNMVSSLHQPNEYVFSTVLSACAHSGRVFEGMQCHGFLFKFGLVFHHFVKSALVHMYSKCFHVDLALKVLESEYGSSDNDNDAFCYNSVLNALVESRRLREAVEVLGRMVDERVVWDSITYVGVMGLCGQIRDLGLGLQIHAQLLKRGLMFDVYVGSMLVDMFGKCGDVLSARKVFDGLQNRNVVVWTSLMTAYLQNGEFEETWNLLSCMHREGTMANEFTFAVLLNACAGMAALRHGDLLHARVEKLGIKNLVIVGNALINMYSKGGSIDSSYDVFSDMRNRDIITWNAMICGYSQHGLGKQALLLFQDMLSAGECPNHVTFVGVLSACVHLALVNEGFYYLNRLMKHFKVEPGLEHYTCVVAVLCRAGMLEEAENFMRTTQVKWDVVAWRVLLNACNIHRNYNLGKKIAETILQMDPRDMGTYTLLSNMYAKTRSWDSVTTIRKMMRERNVKKEPGVSWIEMRNAVHVFSSDGSNHPECIEIYNKVQLLLEMIKQLGYVPNIEAVLHDVEDEQKESYLNYHSEKLAIAYGLMKIPSPAPIRVIKNLRICEDCHTAVKLISKVTNRLIIVRDASRFHHFRDGTCTCTDHW